MALPGRNNQEAHDQATEVWKTARRVQCGGKDLRQSISSLKSAVTVLGAGVAARAKCDAKHSELLKGIRTCKEGRKVTSFIQAPQDFMDAETTFEQSHAPQSRVNSVSSGR